MRYAWVLLLSLLTPGAGIASAWSNPSQYPSDFEQWVQRRVGPVVFPSDPQAPHGWDELTSLTVQLGARSVKTWVGTTKPGEALAKLQTEPYRRLIRQFPVVHFNVSQGYIADGMRDGRLASANLEAARREWYEITRFLCRESREPRQVILLSVAGELNAYLGTAKAHPGFPVAEFVNACHAAKEQALAEWGAKSRPQVYSVAELQYEIEFESFAARWVPQFNTDLISISYYAFFRGLDWYLDVLRRAMRPIGPFGRHRLMMGEYGHNLETCNWNTAELARWHDEILREAFRHHLQFAFFYLLADEPFVVRASGYHGLVGWSADEKPTYRPAWSYYHDLYHGKKPTLPAGNLYEPLPWKKPVGDAPLANLVVSDLKVPEGDLRAGQIPGFSAVVSNRGETESAATTLNYFVDDRLISWIYLAPLKPGESRRCDSSKSDPRYSWRAIAGPHRVSAVVDIRRNVKESTVDDNAQAIRFMVLPARAGAKAPEKQS